METFAIGFCDEDLRKLSEEKLNEEFEKTYENINSIQEWLYEKNYTKRTDETFILMCLRSCKFQQKKTKEKIEKYYALRRFSPGLFKWRDPSHPDMLKFLQIGYCIPVNYNTLTGTKVVIFRPGLIDPWNASFEDTHNLALMIGETCLLDKQSQILGYDFVVDFTNFGISHLGFFTPNVVRTYSKALRAYPFMMKGLHIINLPIFAYGLLTIFKSVLTSKLKKRIHLYGSDFTTLHERIPSNSLPEEYGGTIGPLSEFNKSIEATLIKNNELLRNIFETAS